MYDIIQFANNIFKNLINQKHYENVENFSFPPQKDAGYLRRAYTYKQYCKYSINP